MTQLPDDSPKSREEFEQTFLTNVTTCQWEPHPLYSVFTQYDQQYYLDRARVFLCKYKCFYAVSKTISPKKIIEMGVLAGSSADAYLSAAPGAEYLGIDRFDVNTRHDEPVNPQVFRSRCSTQVGISTRSGKDTHFNNLFGRDGFGDCIKTLVLAQENP